MLTALGSNAGLSFFSLSYFSRTRSSSHGASLNSSSSSSYRLSIKQLLCIRSTSTRLALAARFAVSCSASAEGVEQEAAVGAGLQPSDAVGQSRVVEEMIGSANKSIREWMRSADWETARSYKERGVIHEGRIEGFNGGGLLVRFCSLLGFLPYPLLCPYYSCKETNKSIQEIAKDLVGSSISVKVIQVCGETRNLIFSEKDAIWSKFSGQLNVGDIFEGKVGSVEDYGAFVHLRFPDGCYYLTGLVHVSEVSWDLVQDVRDILNEGEEVKVKVIQIDREKSRITLSVKQLEDDPLLETLDKVIPQVGSAPSSTSDGLNIEPLPGLESICKELLQEDGVIDVKIGRKGFEKRVVSQDLELWLSNEPVKDKQFTLLARAGREVQEVYLTTDLNQEDIKKAVQRVLSRIP